MVRVTVPGGGCPLVVRGCLWLSPGCPWLSVVVPCCLPEGARPDRRVLVRASRRKLK
jgi:hypothetical protein